MSHSQTKQTLLFIAPSAYPLGGVQTWLDYLLPGLQVKGYRAVLALTSGHHHSVSNYLATHKLSQIQTLSLSSPTGTIEGRVESIELAIQDIQPDIIVVVNVIDAYQAVNNLRRRRLSKARIVTSIHGIQEDLFAGIKVNSSVIDAVVSTNRLTQKLINKTSNIDASRSLYAQYGVELPLAPDTKGAGKIFTIAYAGRIEESQKRIADLLQIFSKTLRQIDKIRILIAGSGEDMPALEDWLKKESQYATKINYLGVIKPEYVAESIYAKADVLLLTSQWETGPIVAWEAMSHGVCLVSSRYVGYFEEGSLVDGENCLLFDIGNIDAAVEKIHQARDISKRGRINAGAKELVVNKYSEQKSIGAWAECFNAICAIPPKSYSNKATLNIDNGRLTSVLRSVLGITGLRLAERLRHFYPKKFKHLSAGSEWPHSYPGHNAEQLSLDLEEK